MKQYVWILFLWVGCVLGSAVVAAPGDTTVLELDRLAQGEAAPIPVSLEGFSGDALSALRFDLAVQGFKIVPVSEAIYQLSGGSNGDSLIGRVKSAGKTMLNREYRGGKTRAQAHAFADEFVQLPAPSGPGRIGIARSRIVFRVNTGKASEIMLTDYDGYNHIQLTKDGTISRDPAWVPGQNKLLYTSYRSGLPRIYAHDLSTGKRSLVAGFPGLNGSPAVSPNGRRVAMILSKSGSPDLYVANVDGSNLKRLTRSPADESSPCWSPDGRTLCVVSRLGGRPALYKIPATGGAMRRLSTPGLGSITEPSWSPDGKQIAFTSSVGGFQICVVPAQGGSTIVLAQGEDPVWARNSRTLLYTRRSGGRRVLSMLDGPTKQIKDVRRFSGNCSQPDWAR
jgi:TolB protein